MTKTDLLAMDPGTGKTIWRCAPPEGVKMIGRWHRIGGGQGACVAETDDPEALARWAQDWNDLLSFEIYPAADDQTIAKVIS